MNDEADEMDGTEMDGGKLLAQAIAAHELWLDSNGRKGARIRLADHAAQGNKKPRLLNARLDRADARDADVRGWTFEGSSLRGAEVDGLRADGALFHRTSLTALSGKSASFDDATVVRSSFDNSTIDHLSMGRARLNQVGMANVETRKLNLDFARIDGIHGAMKVEQGLVMREAKVEKANLTIATNAMDLRGTELKDSPRFAVALGDKARGGRSFGGTVEGTKTLDADWRGMAAPAAAIRVDNLEAVTGSVAATRAAGQAKETTGGTPARAAAMDALIDGSTGRSRTVSSANLRQRPSETMGKRPEIDMSKVSRPGRPAQQAWRGDGEAR